MIKTVRSGGYMFTPRVEAIRVEAVTAAGNDHEAFGLFESSRISGQIAALVVVSIAALHFDHQPASFWLHRPGPAGSLVDRGHAQLASAIQLLGAAPAAETATADRRRRARLSATRPPDPAAGADAGSPRNRWFSTLRGPAAAARPRFIAIFALPPFGDVARSAWHCGRGDDFGEPDAGPAPATLHGRAMDDDAAICVISVTLLGLWAARAPGPPPLSSFAKAAESFSLNGAAAPLPERGPEEIRRSQGR